MIFWCKTSTLQYLPVRCLVWRVKFIFTIGHRFYCKMLSLTMSFLDFSLKPNKPAIHGDMLYNDAYPKNEFIYHCAQQKKHNGKSYWRVLLAKWFSLICEPLSSGSLFILSCPAALSEPFYFLFVRKRKSFRWNLYTTFWWNFETCIHKARIFF